MMSAFIFEYPHLGKCANEIQYAASVIMLKKISPYSSGYY